MTHSRGALRSGTEGGCCLRAEKQTLLKAQVSGFVTYTVFLDFSLPLHVPSYPDHCFLQQLGRMRQLLLFVRASVTEVLEGQDEMPVCWGKTASEKEENLFAEAFSTNTQFPVVQQFFAWQGLLYCYCSKAHKTLNYSMHANKNLLFFALEMNKATPTRYLQYREKHTVPIVPSSPLSQALFHAERSCCRLTV